MTDMEKRIYDMGILPVIKISDPATALPLAKALIDGGLPAAEITFRTSCAAEAISAITAAYPEMLVGAGTVLTTEQVDRAVAAGASFIVSPGFNPRVVSWCLERGVPVIPGCSTPSDIEAAIELGLSTVKFFPAEAAGGLPMLKAMSAPYGKMLFMPTGGINADNLLSYLKFDKILACGGSFMVKEDLIASGDYATITALTRRAVKTMLGLEFTHVGINCENADEALRGARLLERLFGMPVDERSKSVFAGEAFEFMNQKGPGKHGHIAIRTHFCDRAIAYFERSGFAFDYATATYADNGKPKFIYFKDEICGFGFHLIQK
ncbi:MAG: bifunctional 4-hydroxy-2-oxoglutarate aldolase/2-dehydro-3-deoxy-phosphogluconate aldolase [Clostridia bacterium]|nr:bifunctional 4-hydroxy-2-oxoglutarate aldolase/2-dehydro-3-deoxy-phosphogluconate aldolase [Clostridia bacterium]